MTLIAFIMINVVSNNNQVVLEKIKSLDETLEAYIIFGAFDIIVKAEFKSHDDLSEYVVEKLRSIEEISDTQTNVCATC
ncbi:MAG: Lrp/AsnC ligand binding domain-containing protein [Candidatus Thorarchaeota archaeon]